MTTLNPSVSTTQQPSVNLRDRLKKVSRADIFAVIFILLGAGLLLFVAGIYGEATTRFTFGADVEGNITVPTGGFISAVGVYYLVAGLIGIGAGALGSVALSRLRTLLLFIGGLLLIPTILVIAAAGNSTNITTLLSISLRLSTPLVLGAIAGIYCERCGVANIAIEGMMLSGACFGFVAFTLFAGNAGTPGAQFLGIVAAILSGGLMALLLAWLSITFKTNQIVAGTVINILALGITSYVRREVLFSTEAGRETLQPIPIPLLSDIPVIGDIFFTGRPIFYSMFVLVVVTHLVLFYTRWGLRTRAVGENPRAADTLGINVIRNRWTNVFIGGLIAGLAGAWFSLETSGSFTDNMISGRGFIALAAMIFGKWTPFGAFGGALLFGFSLALGDRFQVLSVPIPPQFLQMVPYVITIVVLAGLVGRAIAPKASGIPYEKEGK